MSGVSLLNLIIFIFTVILCFGLLFKGFIDDNPIMIIHSIIIFSIYRIISKDEIIE